MTSEQPMFTTDLVNLYNRNIFKTSLYIYIFQDEKCRLIRNLSLSMEITCTVHLMNFLLASRQAENMFPLYRKKSAKFLLLN